MLPKGIPLQQRRQQLLRGGNAQPEPVDAQDMAKNEEKGKILSLQLIPQGEICAGCKHALIQLLLALDAKD